MAKLSLPTEPRARQYKYLVGAFVNLLLAVSLFCVCIYYYNDHSSYHTTTYRGSEITKPPGPENFIMMTTAVMAVAVVAFMYIHAFMYRSHGVKARPILAITLLVISIAGGLLLIFIPLPREVGVFNVFAISFAFFQLAVLYAQQYNQAATYRDSLEALNGPTKEGVAHAAYVIHQIENFYKFDSEKDVSTSSQAFIRNAIYLRLGEWVKRLSNDNERAGVIAEMCAYRNIMGVNKDLKDGLDWLVESNDFVDAPMPSLTFEIHSRPHIIFANYRHQTPEKCQNPTAPLYDAVPCA